eukprot:549669_1
MMNLSSLMITAGREILFMSYSLQFGPHLWWNICVFAIKNYITYYGCSGLPDNYITTPVIIIRVVYMDYLSYSEWFKFYYIAEIHRNKTIILLIEPLNKTQYTSTFNHV